VLNVRVLDSVVVVRVEELDCVKVVLVMDLLEYDAVLTVEELVAVTEVRLD
jgi:hypothetical protein